MRIKYDDGDSEDFDIDCLTEGLELYEQYKHKDTLRGVNKAVPSTTTSDPSVAKKNADKNDATRGDKAGESDKGCSQDNDNVAGINSNKKKAITPTKSKPRNVPDKVSSGEIGKNIEMTNSNVHTNPTNTTSNAEQGKLPGSTITPETNPQSTNADTEMRDSDHSSIKKFIMTGNGNGNDNDDNDPHGSSTGNGDDDGNDNEDENDSDNDSSSSDEVEIVGVMVPYRGNPSLLGFADAGGDGTVYYENNGDSANNPFSIYEEGVYDF